MNDTLKNDTLKCEWCSKDFQAQRSTARFCSAACKLKFNRKQGIDKMLTDKNLPPTIQASKIPIPPKKQEVEIIPEPKLPPSGKPTPPEWYIHGTRDNPNQTWDRVCVRCGEKYTTSLELMRFCSDQCKSEAMVVIANGPHKKYVESIRSML